jgi:predicted NACHT family NTPase
MADPTGSSQGLIDSIANNKLYLAIASGALGVLLFPLLRFLAQKFWALITEAFTSLNRNRRFQADYLSWLINANKYISVLPTTLAGVKSGTLHHLELDQIYITLDVSRGEDIGRPLSLEELLGKHRRIIILGDPGAGKSTMMQYVTLQAAYQLTGKPCTLKYSLNGFPILIHLNKFVDIEQWDKEKGLLAAIIGEVENNSHLKVPPEYLENQLKEGKCLILLDAFDELATDRARRLLSEKVKNFVAAFPDNQCLVTSRITGYSHQLAEAGFEQPFTIQNLSPEHISTFIVGWYENLAALQARGEGLDQAATGSLQAEYQNKAANLGKVVLKNPGIRELAVNPILLSLITLVHYVKYKLPEQRHRLYQECVDILVEQWDSVKDVKFSLFDRLEIQEKKRILQRLAFHLHDRKLRTLPKTVMVREALQPACQDICGEKIKENEVEKFLALIQERTGLLVEKGFNEQGEPEISFSHLTFQEYLTSLEFLDKYESEEKVWQEIRTRMHADPAWWQETAVLCLSQMKKRDDYIKNLYQEIFGGMRES